VNPLPTLNKEHIPKQFQSSTFLLCLQVSDKKKKDYHMIDDRTNEKMQCGEKTLTRAITCTGYINNTGKSDTHKCSK